MKKILLFCLLLQGCGEREVKRMIIEPDPPPQQQQVIPAKECHLHFDQNQELSKIAVQGSRISQECGLSEAEFINLIEAELN